jgi:PPOX class probable F420-dependent enzyme
LLLVASIDDPDVRELLEKPNFAVLSTSNPDGSIHSTMTWIDAENGSVAVNSAAGRRWPSNLERDPHLTAVVYEQSNPDHYVEIRGVAKATTDGADEHVGRLAKKYLDEDTYPSRQPGEQRIKVVVTPQFVRHYTQ